MITRDRPSSSPPNNKVGSVEQDIDHPSLPILRSLHSIPLALALLLLLWREGAQDLGDAVDDVLLVFGAEPLLHLLHDGVERRDVGGPHVEDHDELALGERVGAQPLHQLGDDRRRRAAPERLRLLAQRAGERLEVLDELLMGS